MSKKTDYQFTLEFDKLAKLFQKKHDAFWKNKKGETLLFGTLRVNDEPGKYDQIGYLSIWNKKNNENTFIGNIKLKEPKEPLNNDLEEHKEEDWLSNEPEYDEDDLPF